MSKVWPSGTVAGVRRWWVSLALVWSALAATHFALYPAQSAELTCGSSRAAGHAPICLARADADLAQDEVIQIATFDSGFGGFFTAKSIEESSRTIQSQYRAHFSIRHYGDTLRAPYGEKTPEQIAQFAAQGIFRAFRDGAQRVFIACNTASIRYPRIKEILDSMQPGLAENTVSIIESSVAELKRQVDERFKTKSRVRVGILATPATVKAQAYPKAVAAAYGVALEEPAVKLFDQERWYKAKGSNIQSANYAASLKLPGGRVLEIYQIGPGNWVDMIEHAAAAEVQDKAVRQDLKMLSAAWNKRDGAPLGLDVVGQFCTHYPVFDKQIREHTLAQGLTHNGTTFVKQGPLMAGIFETMMRERLNGKTRARPLAVGQNRWLTDFSRPQIFISGNNVEETKGLAQTIFAQDPVPKVTTIPFVLAGKASD